MLHTYSLIHDDLPCMDDDDTRRGKPSNHIKYGEFTAILAGDALQAAAFEALLNAGLPPAAIADMGRILAEAAGPYGICAGQYLDLLGEGKRPDAVELEEIHRMKTAALISAAARIGVVAAGGSPEQIKAAEGYALAVGFAFQIRDDMLDDAATAEELGKPAGSDRKNCKTTFATLFGAEKCDAIIRAETEKAVKALDGRFNDAGFLVWLARKLAERKY
jgi:geranylgeranyl diphosphate synthase type II